MLGVMKMIGEKLKELRESLGLSRKAIAELINKDQTTYGKYELGKREPDSETLKKLADIFRVSVDELLGRQEMPKDKGNNEVELSEKDMKGIKRKAEFIKNSMMNSVGLAFDGQPEDEDTLKAVMTALEEGMILAKKEAKEKYTPKKYRK